MGIVQYFVLVGMNLLPAEDLPSMNLQLLHMILTRLPVRAENACTQLFYTHTHTEEREMLVLILTQSLAATLNAT